MPAPAGFIGSEPETDEEKRRRVATEGQQANEPGAPAPFAHFVDGPDGTPSTNETKEQKETRWNQENAAKQGADAAASAKMQADIAAAEKKQYTNHFQYGGYEGGASQAADYYQRTAAGAQGRQIYDQANRWGDQNFQSRGQQVGLADMMRRRATGETPSIAAAMGQQATGRLVADQSSIAAGARGPAAIALAQQQNAANSAQGVSAIANQTEINAANERMQAEQNAFGAYSGIRGGDAAMNAQTAQQAQAQQGLNDAFFNANSDRAVNVNTTQLGAQQNEVGVKQAADQGNANRNQAAAQANQAHQDAQTGMWVGLGGALFGTAALAIASFLGGSSKGGPAPPSNTGGGSNPVGTGIGGDNSGGIPAPPSPDDDPTGKPYGTFAAGGPIGANKLALVGEEGPELIIPRKDGYVLTAEQTRRLIGSGGYTPREDGGPIRAGGEPAQQWNDPLARKAANMYVGQEAANAAQLAAGPSVGNVPGQYEQQPLVRGQSALSSALVDDSAKKPADWPSFEAPPTASVASAGDQVGMARMLAHQRLDEEKGAGAIGRALSPTPQPGERAGAAAARMPDEPAPARRPAKALGTDFAVSGMGALKNRDAEELGLIDAKRRNGADLTEREMATEKALRRRVLGDRQEAKAKAAMNGKMGPEAPAPEKDHTGAYLGAAASGVSAVAKALTPVPHYAPAPLQYVPPTMIQPQGPRHIAGMGEYSGVGAREDGGPVDARKPYLVGERGPELIMPQSKIGRALAGEVADAPKRKTQGRSAPRTAGEQARMEAESWLNAQPGRGRAGQLDAARTASADAKTATIEAADRGVAREQDASESEWRKANGQRAGARIWNGSEAEVNTKLTPREEAQFVDWKQRYAPDDSGEDYDLRGAMKAGFKPDPETGHWPDTFKKPNHPTFSDQSQYAKHGTPGHWNGDTFIPPSDSFKPFRVTHEDGSSEMIERPGQDLDSPVPREGGGPIQAGGEPIDDAKTKRDAYVAGIAREQNRDNPAGRGPDLPDYMTRGDGAEVEAKRKAFTAGVAREQNRDNPAGRGPDLPDYMTKPERPVPYGEGPMPSQYFGAPANAPVKGDDPVRVDIGPAEMEAPPSGIRGLVERARSVGNRGLSREGMQRGAAALDRGPESRGDRFAYEAFRDAPKNVGALVREKDFLVPDANVRSQATTKRLGITQQPGEPVAHAPEATGDFNAQIEQQFGGPARQNEEQDRNLSIMARSLRASSRHPQRTTRHAADSYSGNDDSEDIESHGPSGEDNRAPPDYNFFAKPSPLNVVTAEETHPGAISPETEAYMRRNGMWGDKTDEMLRERSLMARRLGGRR